MWLALLITFFIIFFKLIFNRSNSQYLFSIFMVFFVISAFRSVNVGNDTGEYKSLYEQLSFQSIEHFAWRFEKGYLIYNKVLNYLTDNSQVLFVISAFIICVGYSLIIKKYSQIPWLSVYLFFMLRYFDLSMNILRQSLAMVILFYGFYLLVTKEKTVSFILVVLLATTFHRASIIFLVVLLLRYVSSQKYFFISLSLVTALSFIAFNRIYQILIDLMPVYSYYTNSSYMDGDTRTATVLNIFVNCVILLFVYMNGFEKNRLNILLLDMFVIGIAITVISLKFTLLDRVSDLFTVYAILLIPNSVYYNRSNINLSRFWIYLILVSFFIYYLIIILYRPEWNRIYPYEFFWANSY